MSKRILIGFGITAIALSALASAFTVWLLTAPGESSSPGYWVDIDQLPEVKLYGPENYKYAHIASFDDTGRGYAESSYKSGPSAFVDILETKSGAEPLVRVASDCDTDDQPASATFYVANKAISGVRVCMEINGDTYEVYKSKTSDGVSSMDDSLRYNRLVSVKASGTKFVFVTQGYAWAYRKFGEGQ